MEEGEPWWHGLMRSSVRTVSGGVSVEYSPWTPTLHRILEGFFLKIKNPERARLHLIRKFYEGTALVALTQEPVELLVLAEYRQHLGPDFVPEVDEYFVRVVRGMHNRLTREQHNDLVRRIPACLRSEIA